MKKIIIILLILGVGVGAIMLIANNRETEALLEYDPNVIITSTRTETDEGYEFSNGTYQATLSYYVPKGHPDEITVTLTLADDIVTDLEIGHYASNGESEKHQARFKQDFDETEIIGKSLTDVAPSRIGGATITSKAFENTLLSIADEAKISS